MIFVLDRHEKVRAIFTNNGSPGSCPYYDDVMKEDLSTGVATYEFRVPTNHPNADLIEEGGYVVRADLDGNLRMFTIIQVEETHAEQSEKYVYAEDAGLELLNDIVRPNTYYSVTIDQALDIILQDTRWERGRTDYLGVQNVVIEDYQTVVSALQTLGELYGGELSFRVKMENGEVVGRYVDMVKQRGTVTKKRFVFNKDILNIKRTVDMSELATALIGIGKGDADGNYTTFRNVSYSKSNGDPFDKPLNQDWVGDPDALQRYGVQGKHLFGVFQYETDNAEELLNATWNELQKRKNPKITYELDVALLERLAGIEHEKVRIGDTVYIIDETFSPALYLEARIIALETCFSDPSKDKCTLGNFKPAVSNITAQMRALQSQLLRKAPTWDEAKAKAETAITTAETASQTATNAQQVATTAQQTADTANQTAATAQQTAQQAQQTAQTAEQKAEEAKQYVVDYAEPKPPADVPAAPANFSATGAFKKVVLTWDVDTSKVVAYYELYASQTAGFTPSSTNLIYKGKTSGFTHDVDVNQTWYYRLRAVNAYGQAGAFTNEVSASTVKIISDDILFGAVNAQHLADLAVTAQKLADGAVVDTKIADRAVNNAKLADLSVSAEKLLNGAVDSTKLADLAVTAQKLADGSITTPKITDGAINTAKIVDDAITQAKIAAGAVGNTELDRSTSNKVQIVTNDLVDGAVNTLKIASGAVDNTRLANLAVDAAKLADGSVSNTKVANNAITNTKLADLAVTAAKLVDGSVTAAKVADGAVGTTKIQDGSVTSAKVGAGQIGTTHIADASITSAKIQDASITNAKIADASITSAKIVDGSITNAKIANAAIDNAKIATGAIGTAQIQTGAIATGLIADGAITSAKIQNAAIGTAHIADASITDAKVANLSANKINAGTIDTSRVTVQGTNAKLKISGNRLQVFDNQPTPVERVTLGDVNGDGTVFGFRVRGANGTTILMDENGVRSEGITDGAVTNPKIADSSVGTTKIKDAAVTNSKVANASIDTAKIQTGAITTALIADAAITSAKIQNLAVGTAQIADGSIVTAKIGNAQITGAKIANATIGTANIADGSITSAKIGNAQIGTAHIIDGSINTAEIADAAITSAKISSLAVGTGAIQDGAITNAKIANLAVDSAKIADAAITSAHIANAAVGAAAIANAAIGTAHIADGAITNAKIANAAIDNAKIANLDASKITSGYISADRIAANSITAQKIAIADFTNLSQIDENTNSNGNTVVTVNNKKYFRVGTGAYAKLSIATTKKVEFRVNDEYFIRFTGYREAGVTSVTFIIRYFYTDGSWANAGSVNVTPGTSSGTVQATVKITGAVDEAKTLNYIDFFFEKDSGTRGYYYIADIELRKRQQGELIVDGAITAQKIAAGAITAGSAIIADGAIITAKIADAAITSAKIASAAIGTAAIADAAITSAKIANLAVGTSAIADAAITSAKIASAAVGNAAIANAAITNAKIANLAVSTAQIQDGAITNVKIANAAIDSAKIAGAAITNAKIANLAVGTAQIADGAITNAKIANAAIDNAKIANLDASKITSGYISANRIQAGSITADKLNVTSLSAISANLGTVMAGNISGVTITGSEFIIDEQFALGNVQYHSTMTIDSLGFRLHTNSLTDALPDFDYTLDPAGGLTISFQHYSTGETISSFEVNQDGVTMTGDMIVNGGVGADSVTADVMTTDRINGLTYEHRIYFSPNGPYVDAYGGDVRWKQSDGNYIHQNSTGDVRIYAGGTVKHTFYANGTKSGGSIEIDGINWGMSPIDSPRVMIADLITNVDISPFGTEVRLESRFAKTLERYSVFPSDPTVKIIKKEADRFIAVGSGTCDFYVIGVRVGCDDVYFNNLSILEEKR
ncbi:phage tail spike protein [Geobacillus stearothermophilus]|nr:phage tail spike protein [Geobacillus stearothermophilus]